MSAAARLAAAVEAGEPVSGFRVGAPVCEVCGDRATLVVTADAFACERCDVWLDPVCDDPACLCCWNRERLPSAVLGRKRGLARASQRALRVARELGLPAGEVREAAIALMSGHRTIGTIERFRCPDCGRLFARRGYLEAHRRQTTKHATGSGAEVVAEKERRGGRADAATTRTVVCPCGNARTNLNGPPRCPDCKAGGPRHVRQSAIRDQRSAAYYGALVSEIMGTTAALVGGTAS